MVAQGIVRNENRPKISSMASACKILEAPTSPDRHAEKTAQTMPMITNGCQMLISCKNK